MGVNFHKLNQHTIMFLVKDGFCLLTHWPYIQFRSIWELKKMLCALTVVLKLRFLEI